MKLDVNAYKATLVPLTPILKKKVPDLLQHVGIVSAAFNVPTLAVILYCLRPQVLGEKFELRKQISGLINFYRYTEIIDWRESVMDLPAYARRVGHENT